MKTYLPEAYEDVFCPACRTRADHAENTPIMINRQEQEYLIECKCGGRYFCIWVEGVLDGPSV